MSSSTAFEESKDKALEVLATHLSDDELVDFSNYNMQGAPSPEDRERLMSLTNKHQQALWELGEAVIDGQVVGAGALEVFVDMLAMTEEALRQLRQTETPEGSPEVGGRSPGTDLGQVD
ncbi:hypothetical protein UCDDA912_g02997 [Diaporthe ampelina]|uniref:Uncharacterized protein n=1 Tax=Diaporthe ampelina TaxID=1214573 RepID=A0A0G2FS34_9PEZI|nr:hypothetical protein UCDDA912_g02997 [Diaporthe ampelina]